VEHVAHIREREREREMHTDLENLNGRENTEDADERVI